MNKAIILTAALAAIGFGGCGDDGSGGSGGSGAASGGGAGLGGGGNGAGAEGGGAAGGGGAPAGGGGAGAGGAQAGGGGAGPASSVVLNEVAPDGQPEDWIELTNTGAAQVDISGWYFTDDDPTHIYSFPAGTTLAPGAYLVVQRWDGAGGAAPDTQFDFGINNEEDAVSLYDPADVLIDSTTWTVAPPGIEDPNGWARIPDGTGTFSIVSATQGASND